MNKLSSFFNRTKSRVSFSATNFFKTDEQQELLSQVNAHLLVWEQQLINLVTGESIDFTCFESAETAENDQENSDNSDKEKSKKEESVKQTRSEFEQIALAAQQLLSAIKNPYVALYLSPLEFVATQYQLPNIAIHNVQAALKYQVSSLLPAYPRPLLLACHHNTAQETNVALWFDQPRSEDFFNAFKEQKLNLVTLIPRLLLALPKESTDKNKIQLEEMDTQGKHSIIIEHQSIVQWSHIDQDELLDSDYFSQWKNELLVDDSMLNICVENSDFYKQFNTIKAEQFHYAFFPDATRHNLKKSSRFKKSRLIVIASIIVLLAVAAPFVRNMVRYNRYEEKYLLKQEQTKDVQQQRAAVTQFEDNWALFLEYPKLDATAVLAKLNKIIPKNSWISVFELKGNEVEIEGNGPNSAGILATISKQKEFEDVAFSQRTRSQRGQSEHFGISFRLKNNNIEEYRKKFLAEPQ